MGVYPLISWLHPRDSLWCQYFPHRIQYFGLEIHFFQMHPDRSIVRPARVLSQTTLLVLNHIYLTTALQGAWVFVLLFFCYVQRSMCMMMLRWWWGVVGGGGGGGGGGMLTFMYMLRWWCYVVKHQWNTNNRFRLEIVEVLASQGSYPKKGHRRLSHSLLGTGAKGMAVDVAQNKHARQQLREIGCVPM